jgi:hypothetical protein
LSNRSLPAWVLVLALLAPSTACGLISSDITDFDLALPNKEFTVDAERWMLHDSDLLTSTTCAPSPDPCAAAAQQACTMGTCLAACNATSHTCDLTLFVSLFQEVNLLTEKPELQRIQDQPIIDVTIDAIKWEVTANTFNLDTPEMVVYAAPSTVMTPDARAKRIGTVPAIPAGTTRPVTAITFDPNGKANLATFMGDYRTAFNIIVGSSVLVQQGDPVPQGALTVRVSVEAHAGL